MKYLKFCSGCDQQALKLALLNIKFQRCAFCDGSESLNRHSFLYGNELDCTGAQRLRGQRVFCSNRGLRGGCGRTFSVYLADVMPRFTVTVSLLWRLLCLLLEGKPVFSVASGLRPAFVLETLYHLLQRLRLRLDTLRSFLCRLSPAPQSLQSDPLLQTVEHLRTAFPRADCPLQQFQLHFQTALMG